MPKIDHLLCAGKCYIRYIYACEQSCDLSDLFLFTQFLDRCECTAVVVCLFDAVVMLRGCCQLGQVSNAQHLVILRNLLEFSRNDISSLTTYACIDLIKDHRSYAVIFAYDFFECQHDP